MAGHAPRLLRINLSTGAIQAAPIAEQVVMDFVEGRGFGIYYLYQDQ